MHGFVSFKPCFRVGVASFSSSSIYVADQIKTLDMSLPSYDEVKSFKASVENVKSLSVQSGPSGSVGATTEDKKKGLSASSVLPSMNKKSAKEKKADKMEYTF